MNTDPTRNQSFYDLTDLNSLRQDALKSTGDADASEEALRKAAQQFESIFTQMMLSSMRKANEVLEDKDSPFNSSSVKFYRDMHDQQMSMQLSSEGSLGLADLIVQQLSPNREGYMPGSVLRIGAELQSDRIANGETNKPAQDKPIEVQEKAGGEVRFDDPESFVSQLWDYAKSAAEKIGLNPAVMVAQAALETGWGKHIIARQDGESSFNLFNIKADKRWQGDSASKMTLEFEQGLPVKKQANFRAYDSLKDSINDYVDFLQSNPRYQDALNKTDNPEQYLDALQQAGYATDPNYAEKIKRVLGRGEFQSMLSASVHQGVN
ncbi:flagellar assembly peptidoglycan hydrolase FlgJ [Pseudoalteromonas rubra]|uniref:Peptidoglycan hydrolase FlgJ n=1 Tax=Pseudoalteromonas rubra TaxID=43658 RepID=A0A5S3WK03_9GAMM|nr:flagellar assembly peptidoglycan hydrolase FlgJ [Pseudoalteromonas rubra]TMP27132.1 flagellar assembly peptidoglycan hydrolase FlgJ [Pseudoalteromonas rubra]TMP36103.1 flagellar assembly peptidoglycan hydrolase FlgJ [Pseudoalteromonas rubra]